MIPVTLVGTSKSTWEKQNRPKEEMAREEQRQTEQDDKIKIAWVN